MKQPCLTWPISPPLFVTTPGDCRPCSAASIPAAASSAWVLRRWCFQQRAFALHRPPHSASSRHTFDDTLRKLSLPHFNTTSDWRMHPTLGATPTLHFLLSRRAQRRPPSTTCAMSNPAAWTTHRYHECGEINLL